MLARDDLHTLLDAVPEDRLPAIREALERLADPVLLALVTAPAEDEELDPDELAELEMAEAERATGTIEYVSHEELGRRIGR
jgi:hypothetical protein